MTDLPTAKPGTSGEAQKVAHTYSVEELMNMRNTLPFIVCNVKKLNSKFSSDVVKVPGDASADLIRNKRVSRDSGSTSRKSISHTSHTPSLSRDYDPSQFEKKGGPWSPEDQEDVILFRGNLALQSHEQKQMWLLRKRGSSDRSSQPLPAPAGSEGQNIENFRKFYAAVISPTHLRVTAGGRIVPNTRGLPHPTFMWNAEKRFFVSTNRIAGPEIEPQKSCSPGTKSEDANHQSPLGVARETPEDLFGPPLHTHSCVKSEVPTEHNDDTPFVAATHDIVEEVGNENAVAPIEGDINATQGHIRISPPSQFDVFRPFFINGQPFYPAPSGVQIPVNLPTLPVNVLANHNASYQTILPPYGISQPAPLGFPVGNFGYSQPSTLENQQVGQQTPLMHNSGMHPPLMISQLHNPFGQHFGMAPIMPIASLQEETVAMHPQVSIVINQIHALQQQFRYLENQLQNNKHQIDEQHVVNQQNHIQNQIRALQSGLKPPIFHNGLLLNEQFGAPLWDTGAVAINIPLPPVITSEAICRAGATGTTSNSQNSFQTGAQGNAVLENADFNSETPGIQMGDSQSGYSSVPTKQTSKKRLSASAAMAPEFQPRSQLALADQSGTIEAGLPSMMRSGDSVVIKEIDPRKKAEKSSRTNVTSWSTPGQWANSGLMNGPTAMSTSHMKHHPIQGSPFACSSVHLQTKHPLSTSNITDREHLTINDDEDPYLMGYPPPGTPANIVKSIDMIYSRELTREELQARQIYWGKAPLALSKGLPKFDGKDFYAPSPDRASISPKAHYSHKNEFTRRSNTSSSNPEPSSPKSGGKMMRPPSRHESRDSQNLSGSIDSIDQRFYGAIEGDTKSPLKTKDDAASLDAWGLAKADEEEIFDRPTSLTSKFNGQKPSFEDADSVKLKRSGSSRLVGNRSAQPSLLQNMLKNTPRTAMAAPTGALSSTVAHGYLPQSSGNAAASLAPSKSSTYLSPGTFKKGGTASLGHPYLGRFENQPLPHKVNSQDHTSAAELLKKFKENEEDKIGNHFSPISKGLGPVYGGSDW